MTKKDSFTDTMLNLHQSSQNSSFSPHSSYQQGKRHQPSSLCSGRRSVTRRCCWVIKGHVHPYGCCSAAAGVGAWQKAHVAADRRHLLCVAPQACPSPVTLLLLQQLPFHIFSLPYSDVALQGQLCSFSLELPTLQRKTKETRNFYGIW